MHPDSRITNSYQLNFKRPFRLSVVPFVNMSLYAGYFLGYYLVLSCRNILPMWIFHFQDGKWSWIVLKSMSHKGGDCFVNGKYFLQYFFSAKTLYLFYLFGSISLLLLSTFVVFYNFRCSHNSFMCGFQLNCIFCILIMVLFNTATQR